ncbi:N-6 DNA methylase [Dysgonomonas sp. HDW5A]|uniref:N-6 DNA methylase n=1 Tax=Dysgonomonas sp. HDW5A TaxID=2714926 RepID=UPI00140B9BFD|nr:N-6 DNA methylase [Dysgonomonas sp. HDW5A]QIK58790.1 N-6 DNA methylase [Dysgonomonas sp. HDW5A]
MDKQDVLKQCYIEDNIIKLPSMQLDRDLYLEVKTALELIGGKWKSGKTQGFVFKEDPTEYLEKLCNGEQINLKKEFQFFATPPAIAERLVDLADIKPEHVILEPSAGQGAIINAIHKVCPDAVVDCFELMDLNRSFLEKLDNINILGNDFLAEKKDKLYDLIIANPPFSKNQDIEHVAEMYKCLKDNGRLISIMSNHWRFASGKKEAAFKEFIEEEGARVYDLEPGDFKESGTNIQACIIVLDRNNPEEVKRLLSILEKGEKKIKEKASRDKDHIPPSESKKAEQEFANMFNDFMYRFSNSEVFIDFLDYCLLVFRWWEPNRDFSYWENKYKDSFPKLQIMFEKLSIASEDGGEGMYDALGDLFMELVSHGRNGQFFTPDNVCDMMAQITYNKVENGQNILDPACGSSRMLLATAKMNRHINLFGCDNDITCCKMSVVNLLLNSLTGEIAHMDSLRMEYHKSWFCYTKNVMGINLPMYELIEDKETSPLWKIHINTFEANSESREAAKDEKEVVIEEQQPGPEETIVIQSRKKKKDTAQLTLNFFE